MTDRLIVLLALLCFFTHGYVIHAQEKEKTIEEITIVEGQQFIFRPQTGVKYEVDNRSIATCNSMGIITARRNGKTRLRIRPSNRYSKGEIFQLKILPKRKVSPNGDFPILAWYSLQEDLSHERFKELAEAGFNLSFSYATDSIVPHMQRAIKAVKGTGVKLVIPFRGPWVDVKPIIECFKDDEGVWGWYVVDEPAYDKFTEVKRFVDKIQAIDQDHPFYINLLPTYAPQSLLGEGSYEHYVSRFIDLFSPQFISFDHYPITNKGVRDDFYVNLNTISRLSKLYQIPFWAFACSVKYSGSVPAPKLAHLKMEVFSALAFGAQGIEYFTYTTPRKEHGGDSFYYAPIDSKHNRTETYDYVKEVNLRLRGCERYFKDAKVIYYGSIGGRLEGITHYPAENLPHGIKLVSPENTLLASWLENDSGKTFVLVNTDIDKSNMVVVECDSSVKKISNDGQIVSVSPVEELLPGDMLVYLTSSIPLE